MVAATTIAIIVSVALQTLTVTKDGSTIATFPVSTSAWGTGFEPGSKKTPTGNFRIYQKIGDGEPIYTIFEGRVPVGVWNPQDPPNNKVLTRIMWLDGLDADNKNTKDR